MTTVGIKTADDHRGDATDAATVQKTVGMGPSPQELRVARGQGLKQSWLPSFTRALPRSTVGQGDPALKRPKLTGMAFRVPNPRCFGGGSHRESGAPTTTAAIKAAE